MEDDNLREAYGKALVRIGKDDPRILALDADLGKSTFSRSILELGDNRYVEVGIAEQNMAGISAGLALAGKIPFFSSFAVFCTGRAYDQIRSSICIPSLNVKLCGSSAGLSDYGDGKTHQSIDDLALMRVLPNMTVLVPADVFQVGGMVEAMAQHNGPCYIRIPRTLLSPVTKPAPYNIGQVDIMRKGRDITIFSCGGSVHSALDAAESLSSFSIQAEVVSLGTIKPFPVDIVRALAEETGAVLVVEEHSVFGGLGSAVFEALAGLPLNVGHMGVDDTFGQSAENHEVLLEHYHLSPTHIVRKVTSMMG